jgi:hypothetical protein
MIVNKIIKHSQFNFIALLKIFLLVAFLSPVNSYAKKHNKHYDDDELITIETVVVDIIFGAIVAGIGFVLKELRLSESIGEVLIGIGAFIGIGVLVVYLLQLLFILIGIMLNIGLFIAIIGLAIFLSSIIVKYIYNLLTGKQ